MKPDLTTEQMEKFRKEFKTLIDDDEEEKQKQFKEDSTIDFIANTPLIHSNAHLHPKLSRKFKSEFTALMNKLKSRTL